MFEISAESVINDIITGVIIVVVLAAGKFAYITLSAFKEMMTHRAPGQLKREKMKQLFQEADSPTKEVLGVAFVLLGLIVAVGGFSGSGTGVMSITIVVAFIAILVMSIAAFIALRMLRSSG